MSRQQKIELYGEAATLLTAALQRFPKEMWQYRPTPEAWTVHEIAVHITDSEANSYVRCRRFIAEPSLPLMAYDENQWARVLNYHDLDVETAVSLFKWLRQSSYQLIQNVPESVWQHQAHHPEDGLLRFEDWLDTYARHVPEHIQQMEHIYKQWQQSQAAKI